MGASQRDIQIALMTALQESGLRNLKYGDRDSQGLFQQRPSMGWGTVAQVTNPEYASRQFFSRLLADSERNTRSMTQAAQHVQRSAYPDAYAKHTKSAAELMQQIGAGGGSGGGRGGMGPSEQVAGPDITPQENLQSVLAQAGQQTDRPTAPGTPGLTLGQSNEVDLSGTIGISSGGFEGPEGDDTAEPDVETPESLGVENIGAGAEVQPTNPLVTEMVTANDQDQPGLDEFSTGTPWRGTDKSTDFIPLEHQTGYTSDYSGGGGASRAGEIAAKYLGTPYVWGAESPLGFDCSGLTSYVFSQMGIQLPRASVDQSRGGMGVSMDKIRPGDLLFWDASSRNGSGADHVAIYIGNGQMIEANGPRGRVVKTGVRGGAWARRYT